VDPPRTEDDVGRPWWFKLLRFLRIPGYAGFPLVDGELRSYVRIDQIERVEKSPLRLPPRLAKKLYDAGETGMGYFIFALVFHNGQKQEYIIMDRRIDFPELPPGVTMDMVQDVLPLGRKDLKGMLDQPKYCHCYFTAEGFDFG